MPDELDSLSDNALNELFAVEAAGWKFHRAISTLSEGVWWRPLDEMRNGKPQFQTYEGLTPAFCTDANAVYPFCQTHDNVVIVFNTGSWSVEIQKEHGSMEVEGYDIETIGEADGPNLARAICTALLRARRHAEDKGTKMNL